ncbi:endolytic transglycosylase MltG [Nocardia fluminea]|uniref:Endolytic murein transglycosylase n=1 Tax=Nocardia fluminea TaxID=134984 RepID=A0A2N3VI59_9NOCA|nr:endolytic transglycosylase MltG [Nocardia fluminea]PKV81318.1 UPF0755 protein [Nocardia fluminea]
MTDRWTRAEERYRAREADRRYPRRDDWGLDARTVREDAAPDRGEWDEDGTDVIPRYEDEIYDDQVLEDVLEPEPEPEPAVAPRRVGQRAAPAERGRPRSASGRNKPTGRAKSPGRAKSRIASRKAAERKKRRRNMWVIAAVFVVLVVSAAGFAGYKLMGSLAPAEDFAGPPGELVVVQVHSGDTATQIADTMRDKGVVASSEAFYEAAVRNSNMNSVQPGFYAVQKNSPAAHAVTSLVSKDSRVGNVVISEGRQLHNRRDVHTGAPTEGIYTKIAAASCLGSGTAAKCVTYEQLDAAGASADLAALGVPDWAKASVAAAPDRRRQLDGLISAGTLDFDPSGGPVQILRQLITASAALYESTGLLRSGAETQLNPYQTLIAASLVEREALAPDMPKVARVIVNRLRIDQPLQFDSTVNYSLEETEVATTDADRNTVTPWNTYAMSGLPANPISAPSLKALQAMENPEPGKWLYFVTIDKKGTTLFTESYAEHLRNIVKAEQSGILDSGR